MSARKNTVKTDETFLVINQELEERCLKRSERSLENEDLMEIRQPTASRPRRGRHIGRKI